MLRSIQVDLVQRVTDRDPELRTDRLILLITSSYIQHIDLELSS